MSIPKETMNPKHRREPFALADLITLAIRNVRRWNMRRGALKDLSRLDARLLRDIGLGAGDLPRLAERMAETASRTNSTGVSQDSDGRGAAHRPAAGASCCSG